MQMLDLDNNTYLELQVFCFVHQ